MTTIPPSGSVAPTSSAASTSASAPGAPAAPAAATPTGTGVLSQLPSNLQSAGPGTVISGTVVAVDAHGQTLLQTNAGVISFATATPLSVGQQISLQIQAAGSQLQAVILSTHGQTNAPPAPTTVPAQLAATTAAAEPAAVVAPSVSAGPVIFATVISAPQTAPAPAPTGQQPASGPAPQTQAPPQQQPAATLSWPAVAAPTARPNAATPAPTPTGNPASQANSTATQPGPPAAGVHTTVIASGQPPAAPAVPQTQPAISTAAAQKSGQSAPNALPAASTSTGAASSTQPTVASTHSPAAPALSQTAASRPAVAATPTSSPTAQPPGPATTSQATSPAPATSSTLAGRPVASLVASYAAPSTTANAPQSTATAPAAARTAPPAVATGTQLQLRLVGDVPHLAGALASAGGGQMLATVIGQTPSGQTIVNTAFGHVAMSLPPNARSEPGTTLAFEIVSVLGGEAGAAMPTAAGLGARSLTGLGREWPALKEALAALAQADPPLAHQASDVAMARLGGPHFLRQILSFLAAPATDVGMLLGHAATSALERAGHGGLAAHLDADLREMVRLNTLPSDWRVLFVPIFEANEPRQLRLFTRRRKGDRDHGRDGSGRFVVEMEFEELGPLQLDGLVHKPRIDLILRSHEPLAADMKQGIALVFENTCASAGLAGTLVFQATPQFPVSPLDEMTKSAGGGVSV